MALVSIFNRRSQGFGDKPNGGNNWLQFDCVVTESHLLTTQVTSSPVQNGSDVANNAINDPTELTIVGVVTDTPFLNLLSSVDNSVVGITGTSENITDFAQSRSQAATSHLIAVKNKRELLTVDTALLRYNNMLLTSISTETNKDTFLAPIFTLTFKEVVIPPEASKTTDGTKNYGTVSTSNPSSSSAVSIYSSLKSVLSGAL